MMGSVDDRDAVIWLHRRAGFGLAAADVDAAVARGPAASLDDLLRPAPPADPWDDAQLPLDRKDKPSRLYATNTWLDLMVASPQPLVERMAWLWHGHFVSAFDKVKVGRLMVDQIRLFRSLGLGAFPDLLRAVTIDPAMMWYLDLRTSTGTEPNENYAREVLELFTLGVGNYAEADVQAGAKALTGWAAPLNGDGARFVARRHDDTPQRYLGRDGVHDLGSVVEAIAAQPAMATFIASTVAQELLGTSADVGSRAAAFTASNFDISTLVRSTLEAGLAGTSAPIVLGPVPWLVWARRVTGAPADRAPARPAARCRSGPDVPTERRRLARRPSLVRLGQRRGPHQPGRTRRPGDARRAAARRRPRRRSRGAGVGPRPAEQRLRPGDVRRARRGPARRHPPGAGPRRPRDLDRLMPPPAIRHAAWGTSVTDSPARRTR